MSHHELAANILGAIGTFLWCVQLVPQIWHNYRKKDTTGLPAAMLLIWAASSIPFGAYSIIQDFSLPLQLQPQIFAILAVVTWGQILYYQSKMAFFPVLVSVTGVCMLIAGGEILLLYISQLINESGITWHLTIIAVFAGVLFLSGFFPAFVEIWKRYGRVAGISFGFLAMDCSGALFSIASLFAHGNFDFQGGSLYLLVILIEFSIASSHVFWLWRTRALHAKARKLGVSFDELPEAGPYQREEDRISDLNSRKPLVGHQAGPGYGSTSSVGEEPREYTTHAEV